MNPGHVRGGAQVGRRRDFAVDEVMTRKVPQCVRRDAATGASRRMATADGLLLLQQRGGRGAARPRRHGAERVAIMDFDVHHGNGTQHIFWDDAA